MVRSESSGSGQSGFFFFSLDRLTTDFSSQRTLKSLRLCSQIGIIALRSGLAERLVDMSGRHVFFDLIAFGILNRLDFVI
jgi:hypothetical protein